MKSCPMCLGSSYVNVDGRRFKCHLCGGLGSFVNRAAYRRAKRGFDAAMRRVNARSGGSR